MRLKAGEVLFRKMSSQRIVNNSVQKVSDSSKLGFIPASFNKSLLSKNSHLGQTDNALYFSSTKLRVVMIVI